jgi:hypothetical protein
MKNHSINKVAGVCLALVLALLNEHGGVGAAPRPNATGKGASASLATVVQRWVEPQIDYQGLLTEYEQAQKAGQALSAEQKRAFANAWLYYGYVLHGQGNLEGATRALRESVRIDPANRPARYGLGLVLRQANQLDEAVEAFRTVAKDDGELKEWCLQELADLTQALFDQAKREAQEGHATNAARCYLFLWHTFPGPTASQALKALEGIEAQADPIAVAVERHAWASRRYGPLIKEHEAAVAAQKALSDSDKRLYSNAYVYWGYYHYGRREFPEGAGRFEEAFQLDQNNDLALYCLGVLEKNYGAPQAAVRYLQSAAGLGGPLKASALRQLAAMLRTLLEQGQSLTERGSFIAAAECYAFVAANFGGEAKATAEKQLKQTEDEVAAEKLLAEARRALAYGQKRDGQRLLRQLLTTYSWTRAAETAKQIYRGTESLEVKVKSDSPAGKYAAREKWIDLETANFVVYYRNTEYAKLVAKRVEETFKRVTEQLQCTGLDWHTQKCKVFVFDDAQAWAEFAKESGLNLEWAAGFSYGTLREVYMYAGDPDSMLNRVLPHELTHVIHREYAREDTVLPLWLLEGLACYNEFTGKEYRYGVVKSALAQNALIPLKQLTALRYYPGASTSLFYAESLMLVEFIMDRFGHDGLVTLHKKLRNEEEFDKLVKRAFKMDFEEFERQWLDYLKTKH